MFFSVSVKLSRDPHAATAASPAVLPSPQKHHTCEHNFLDAQASLAPTHVSPSVRLSVTLSDFQSVSVPGRPTRKVEQRGPQLFVNFESGCF